jgi:DNA-binding NarL/FixJ family response regulator
MPRSRVLLADDHTLLLEGLQKLLEEEYDLVGAVESGKSLVSAALKLRPDAIVMDISMPGLNGIDAARQIRKAIPAAKLIFLTVHADEAYIEEAFRVGARGYLVKQSAARELFEALRVVLQGGLYLTPLVNQNLLRFALKPPRPRKQLTIRQKEILRLVAEGRHNKEIAEALKISIKTVEYHKSRIMTELNIHTAAGLTRYALDRGIIPA